MSGPFGQLAYNGDHYLHTDPFHQPDLNLRICHPIWQLPNIALPILRHVQPWYKQLRNRSFLPPRWPLHVTIPVVLLSFTRRLCPKENQENIIINQTRNKKPPGYYRAARFPGREEARRFYHPAQRLIHKTDVDLSTFRLQLDRVWHVAILGPTNPPEEIAKNVEDILSPGEPATLPPDLLKALLARRKQVLSPGTTWFERHYRPGRRT